MHRPHRPAMALILAGFIWAAAGPRAPAADAGKPRLIDLGSKTCIPCQMMAPILEDLKKEFAKDLQVDFVDVGAKENLPLAQQYNVRTIPTQVFLDAAGKELWRHEGFISRYGILDKWRELGQAFAAKALESPLVRAEPVKPDARPKDAICHLCDGDLDPKGLVVVKTAKGDVRLCGMHHYFVMYSCLTEDKTDFDKKAHVTDFATGQLIAATEAHYLYALEEKTGRPIVRAFAAHDAAVKERAASGGSILGFAVLKQKELAERCGFCDRACYAEDSSVVKVGGLHTWGCCSHCAMGVAARTGADIEVQERDRLTGEKITVKTLGGYVASVEPATAVAWFGQRKNAQGQFVSAGCFHQGFFASADNLKKWLDRNPTATGRMISIDQSLGDKMKMTPAQIANACKIGQCAPK